MKEMWIYLPPSSMSLGSAASDLSDLRDYAFAWALVDVETSGLVPRRDRVLSVAVVTLDADGEQTGAAQLAAAGRRPGLRQRPGRPRPGLRRRRGRLIPAACTGVHATARPRGSRAGPWSARVLSPGGP
ncbi:hypothetical protein GCM10023177_49280 [Streptomyces violaceoruber]